jgi:hypothetical protein
VLRSVPAIVPPEPVKVAVRSTLLSLYRVARLPLSNSSAIVPDPR